MVTTIGVIGGSGLLKTELPVFKRLARVTEQTPAGPAILHVGTIPGTDAKLVFCQRHTAAPGTSYSQPADINYAAIALALKAQKVDVVIAFCSVGTLQVTRVPLGSLVVPDDYFCPADLRPVFPDARGHFVPEFDLKLRREVVDALFTCGMRPVDGGVYVNSRGARFETKAEIRYYARVGDVVGMTCAHEASAAQEVGLRYAAVAMVDNVCNGLASAEGAATDLTLQSFHEAQDENLGTVEKAADELIKHFARFLADETADGAKEEEAAAAAGAGAGSSADVTSVDTIVHARYVIPVEPHDKVLENHAVVMKDGNIVAVLPSDDAIATYTADHIVHLREHVLIPGLVNAHTHISMNLLRGLADDLPLIEWLTAEMWPTEGRMVSPEFCAAGARHAIAEMFRSGTTCFNDMYFFPDAVADVVVETGIRAALAMVVFIFPSNWASSVDEYLEKGFAARDKYKSQDRISWTIGPHAPYTVDDAAFERIQKLSEEHDLRVHLHLHETAGECHDSLHGKDSMVRHKSDSKCRPFANLDRLKLVNERLIGVHMTQLEDDEIARIVEAGASVVHCPTSNLKLASGFCPVAKLEKAGANVAIGTDSSASNNCLDMLAELKLAAVLAKGVSGDTTAVPAFQALRMATLNGAKALGLDSRIGSLVPGKAADMTAIRLDELELSPVYSVVSHLAYVASRESVTDVWVNGVRVLDCQRLTTIDETKVIAEAHEWSAKVRPPIERALSEAGSDVEDGESKA